MSPDDLKKGDIVYYPYRGGYFTLELESTDEQKQMIREYAEKHGLGEPIFYCDQLVKVSFPYPYRGGYFTLEVEYVLCRDHLYAKFYNELGTPMYGSFYIPNVVKECPDASEPDPGLHQNGSQEGT